MPAFEGFDDDFEKTDGKKQYSKSKVPDGDYEAEIASAELRETKAGDVFSLKLTVLTDGPQKGKRIEKAIFFSSAKKVGEEAAEYKKKRINELKVDLRTLGFDVDNWNRANDRPFASQCDAACVLMKGLKVAVRLKMNGDIQNCYMNKRLEDGAPKAFGAAELKAAVGEKQEPFAIDDKKGHEQGDPLPF